jgi:hypothetical protein
LALVPAGLFIHHLVASKHTLVRPSILAFSAFT